MTPDADDLASPMALRLFGLLLADQGGRAMDDLPDDAGEIAAIGIGLGLSRVPGLQSTRLNPLYSGGCLLASGRHGGRLELTGEAPAGMNAPLASSCRLNC